MDKMRWRYGDTNPVVAPVATDAVIEVGDMLWKDFHAARPFSDCHIISLFKEFFLGVAMQRSRSGETAPIRVATTGVFEFECPRRVWDLGEYVQPCGNQSVDYIGSRSLAIGRVAKVQQGLDSVYVAIKSTVMEGGV